MQLDFNLFKGIVDTSVEGCVLLSAILMILICLAELQWNIYRDWRSSPYPCVMKRRSSLPGHTTPVTQQCQYFIASLNDMFFGRPGFLFTACRKQGADNFTNTPELLLVPSVRGFGSLQPYWNVSESEMFNVCLYQHVPVAECVRMKWNLTGPNWPLKNGREKKTLDCGLLFDLQNKNPTPYRNVSKWLLVKKKAPNLPDMQLFLDGLN